MTESQDHRDRAYAAADALLAEVGLDGLVAVDGTLRTLLALAWLQGSQVGANEVLDLMRAELDGMPALRATP